ncbi:MAG: T9SS type A sorting domain-containing protein [Ignavibacteria bacterium]
MKSTHTHALLLIILMFAVSHLNARQGHFRPDSLTVVTISGKVIVTVATFQDTLKHNDSVVTRTVTKYFLDANTNGIAEYELNFGPDWYSPDSSDAVRPLDGETVVISGGQANRLTRDSLIMVIVYDINDKFWRNPYDAYWNKMGTSPHDGRGRGHKGYGFGFMHDSLTTITVSGVALVDTTFRNEQFFIDVNNDQTVDYILNFGPYWYNPSSNAKRPAVGDSVVIVGGLLNKRTAPMIIVYSINGQVWRDSITVGKDLGGCWSGKDIKQGSTFHSPFDTNSFVTMRQGWSGGGMMNNDLYGQILELVPGDVPNQGNEKVMAAYEISLFDRNGNNVMLQNGKVGNHINFGSSAQVQLHFTDYQLQWNNFNKSTVQVKYWDNNSDNWTTVSNASLSPATNSVSFLQNTVGGLVILTAEQSAVSDVVADNAQAAGSYALSQNYPNPFNPTTVINYAIPKAGMVTLKVYNILGKEVATLISGNQVQGSYSVEFNASDFPSGMYIYQLKSADFVTSKKMLLVK